MTISSRKTLIKFSILVVIYFNSGSLFSQSVTVEQDTKFDQLLTEKRKVNTSITTYNAYKIQVFNGSSEESKKVLLQFKRDNKNYDATIIFNTPTYKVWVGNYKSRIDAERNLALLKKKFPNAIIIKPSKF